MEIVMDVRKCIKATVLALSFLSMVTWLSYMYSCVKAFFMESLPSAISAAVAPNCLFVFSNIIVVFLVSQSRLSRRSETPATEDAAAAAAEQRSEITMLHVGLEQVEEAVMTEAALLLPAITGDRNHEHAANNMVMVVDQQEQDTTTVVNEGPQMMKQYEEKVNHEVDEVQGEVEEQGGFQLVLRNKMSRDMEQESVEEELEEEEELPPADELNRRVEDFIARFNMERQLEATMLVSCF